MAVWVYRDDQKALIEPCSLHAHLTTGWSVMPPKAKEQEPKRKRGRPRKQEPQEPQEQTDDGDES